MSKFLKALAKVGLVELEAEQARALEASLDPEEARRIVSEAREVRSGRSVADSPSANSDTRSSIAGARGGDSDARGGGRSPAVATAGVGSDLDLGVESGVESGVEEGRPFEVFYEAAGVPTAPYSAEKLLKVLDGLRAMEPVMRKAAILAMDAADDDWTIDDPILDAERKTRVLDSEKKRLLDVVREVETRSAQEIEAIAKYEEEATATIRKQIADLEALLGRELAKGAQDRADSQARLKAAREACARETVRIDEEISRLRNIALTFHDSGASRTNHPQGLGG